MHDSVGATKRNDDEDAGREGDLCGRGLSRWGCLLSVIIIAASAQIAQAQTQAHQPSAHALHVQAAATTTALPFPVPTVAVPRNTPIAVPTLTIPHPTRKPRKHSKPAHHQAHATPTPVTPRGVWITAFLTSYCPGSAGWL